MKTVIITICLIGSVFANPILHNVLVSNEQDSNSTESLSVSQSSENTSEIRSSEEVASTQSTESESSESASEDKTSEESDSQSDEIVEIDTMLETKDNSMGSEENVRKVQSWIKVFSSVGHVSSAEDNTSKEVEGHSEGVSKELTHISVTAGNRANRPLLDKPIDSSSSDSTDLAAANSNSTESDSSESQESEETSDSSDASKSSKDSDESDESDSAESEQVKAKDCVNGTQSCESEEYFVQSVGDDAHFSVHGLMMPDEENMELRLRR